MKYNVKIESSNRHVHLTQQDVEDLFGAGYQLTPKKFLADGKAAFASEETVTLIGPKGKIANVRIISPLRKRTQVELLRSDSFTLGVKAPVRNSGDLDGGATLTLEGPKGQKEIPECGIIALRHIHMGTNVAIELGKKDQEVVDVTVGGERGLTFNNTLIHTIDTLPDWCVMHIDQEEANAAGLSFEGEGTFEY